MEVKAIKEIRYAGANYAPGKRFHASEKDAKILIAIGKVAEYVPVSAKVEKKVPVSDGVEDEAKSPKPAEGRYRRRDLRA
jgi:hypothetical protein